MILFKNSVFQILGLLAPEIRGANSDEGHSYHDSSWRAST